MTEEVLTIAPDRSLRDAAQFLTEHNVGAAVIVDPEQPGPGIVTERDIVRSLGKGGDPDREQIRDHLTARRRQAPGQRVEVEIARVLAVDDRLRLLEEAAAACFCALSDRHSAAVRS